jgi:hypothetical protein
VGWDVAAWVVTAWVALAWAAGAVAAGALHTVVAPIMTISVLTALGRHVNRRLLTNTLAIAALPAQAPRALLYVVKYKPERAAGRWASPLVPGVSCTICACFATACPSTARYRARPITVPTTKRRGRRFAAASCSGMSPISASVDFPAHLRLARSFDQTDRPSRRSPVPLWVHLHRRIDFDRPRSSKILTHTA